MAYMTLDQARVTRELLIEAGCKGEIDIEEFGFGTGRMEVVIRHSNPRTGNRSRYAIGTPVTSGKEAALHVKAAAGKASERDKATLAQMAAERAVNQE